MFSLCHDLSSADIYISGSNMFCCVFLAMVLSQKRPMYTHYHVRGYPAHAQVRMLLLFFEFAILEQNLGHIHCHALALPLIEFWSQHQVTDPLCKLYYYFTIIDCTGKAPAKKLDGGIPPKEANLGRHADTYMAHVYMFELHVNSWVLFLHVTYTSSAQTSLLLYKK